MKGFFEGLSDKLNAKPEKVAGMNCVYQFPHRRRRLEREIDGREGRRRGRGGSHPELHHHDGGGRFPRPRFRETERADGVPDREMKVAGDMGLALSFGSFIG